MKFIIGKKIEMTQRYDNNMNIVPLTIVKAGPCVITQKKDEQKDGYFSVQVGFGNKKRLNKPLSGHLKGLGNFFILKEFKEKNDSISVGDMITVDTFAPGDKVKVTGTSKGKGFQGVVKRHHFHGAPKTHGDKDQLRCGGSIGATHPNHVFRGKRMPGRTGGEQVCVSGLEIFEVDKDNDLLYIKGAVPGHRNAIVLICGNGDLKVGDNKENKKKDSTKNIKEESDKNEKQESIDAQTGETVLTKEAK